MTWATTESFESLTGELIIARAACFMVIAFIEIAVFLGLAVYVVTRNPRRPISWVFGAVCFRVANFYLSSLFLFPGPGPRSPVTPFPLRWKWEVVMGIGGLIAGYRAAFSPSPCRHIVYLLIPTRLLALGGVGTWIIILKGTGRIPFELMDVLLILAAFFYTRAVFLYGSFVGRLLHRRGLFHSTLGAIAGLAALYLTTTLDRWLAAQADSRKAVLYLTRLLAIEPADETAHRALISSYLARGRRDLLPRQVARWRQTLDEIDLEPSPEARAL